MQGDRGALSVRLGPALPGVCTNRSLVHESVCAELFTVGVIATFALLPVWLTSQKNKARLQWRGSLMGSRRASLCKGLHTSKVIPFSLPLSATNDLHDAARIQFHICCFDILYHYWRHYCSSTPVSLTHVFCLHLLPPICFFHSMPTYSIPLVTLKNKYIHAITARSPRLLMMRYLERKR